VLYSMSDERFANIIFFIACIGLPVNTLVAQNYLFYCNQVNKINQVFVLTMMIPAPVARQTEACV